MFISRFIPGPIRSALRQRRERSRLRAIAMSGYAPQLALIEKWVRSPNEVTNWTYDITDASKLYLTHFVAALTGIDAGQARAYLVEIDQDEEIVRHIRERTLAVRPPHADTTQHVGRRMGWYALVRALRPRMVVETGIDKGLGSCVLSRALLRNAEEGFPGVYVGTDIDPNAGYLYTAPYTGAGKILYGDSIESLKTLTDPIDLFINDSDHSADYEALEYQTIAGKLSPSALVLGDNAHVTTKLAEFAAATGRGFLYWPEKPKDHWYSGSGIGAAFPLRKLSD
jgi:predicted O-methyltransferase YrrM